MSIEIVIAFYNFSNIWKTCRFHDKDDSVNGSKTQSAATTESNTPENTIRVEGMVRASQNFTIDNNEVVLESKFRV